MTDIKGILRAMFGFVPAYAGAAVAGVSSAAEAARPQRVYSTDSGGDSQDTVTARRRRPSGDQSGPRERADAPERQQDQSGGGGGGLRPSYPASTSGGSGGAGASGGQPNMMQLIIGVIVLIVMVVLGGPAVLNQGGQAPDVVPTSAPAVQFPTAAPVLPTATRPAVSLPPATSAPVTGSQPPSTSGQKWLVMLYQDADDKVLEQDIYVDLNEAERVGSTDRVQIVAQMDRFRGAYAGDGDWTGVRRYYVTKDNDLSHVSSKLVTDLGEVNMSDPRTLVDFATWAMKAYPADKYVLILSDHGMGWPGGFSDNEPATSAHDKSIPLVGAVGNIMNLNEIDNALGQIRSQTGLDKFELFGFDACLMSSLEVWAAVAPHARYGVGSEETEPALGWAYTAFLQTLTANPNMSGAELGKAVVQSYIASDQRIVDPQARAELLGGGGQGGGLGGLFGLPVQQTEATAQQVADEMEVGTTLAALDLSRLDGVMSSFNSLAYILQGGESKAVSQARTYARSYTSVWGSNVPPSYIDLAHFIYLVKQQSANATITQAVDAVIVELSKFVIAEKHGDQKKGSNGVSIYFPNSQLYGSAVAGPQSYTAVAKRFSTESLWDDYLSFFFTGRRFEATSKSLVVPDKSTTIKAPAAGKITVSGLKLSAKTVRIGKSVTLSADITGANIGYIYLFVGYVDAKTKSIYVADIDYLDSSTTRELQGAYYPDWGSTKFTLKFDWEPIMFSLTDGKTTAVAMLNPESYGASPETALYTVNGIYTSGGDSRYARLYLANGVLQHAYTFTGDGTTETGAPREVIPQAGDTFTILEQWMDPAASGQATKSVTQKGKTLTFSNQTIKWKELDAAAGQYVVGFIVTDLDGNRYEAHDTVTVQ